jgi:hypothetical protein
MTLRILLSSIVLLAVSATGCRSTPVAIEAPPHVTATVSSDLEAAWTSTRNVLLDRGLQIYVRDKRGMFVAYTETKRKLIFFPERTKLTVTLREATPGETLVAVETIRQHYRVTLLTYPDWRDVPGTADEAAGQSLLDAIVANVNGVENEGATAVPLA